MFLSQLFIAGLHIIQIFRVSNAKTRRENLIGWIKAHIDESAIVNIFAMNIGRNNAFVDVLTFIMSTIEHVKQEGRSKLWIESLKQSQCYLLGTRILFHGHKRSKKLYFIFKHLVFLKK
jgi:hypothetical protein